MPLWRPFRGTRWPHGMSITVEDTPQALLELLWVREAWGLHLSGDGLPPLLVDTPQPRDPASRRGPAERTAWTDAWPALWAAALHHAGTPRDPADLERLRRTADGSAERATLLERLRGPSWSGRFGGDTLGPSYRAWFDAVVDDRVARHRMPGPDPERVALAALVPAWKAGLTIVITVPCRGEHTRQVGAHALLVTTPTHDDADRYARALATFVAP